MPSPISRGGTTAAHSLSDRTSDRNPTSDPFTHRGEDTLEHAHDGSCERRVADGAPEHGEVEDDTHDKRDEHRGGKASETEKTGCGFSGGSKR